jgi:hypothetical protein
MGRGSGRGREEGRETEERGGKRGRKGVMYLGGCRGLVLALACLDRHAGVALLRGGMGGVRERERERGRER